MDIEQIELSRYHDAIRADLANLIEKYRTIFDWDIPDIDEQKANALILSAIRQALDKIENASQNTE